MQLQTKNINCHSEQKLLLSEEHHCSSSLTFIESQVIIFLIKGKSDSTVSCYEKLVRQGQLMSAVTSGRENVIETDWCWTQNISSSLLTSAM